MLSGHHDCLVALYTPVVDHSAGAATLERPRVTSLLSAAWQRRATLVVAGGGYGKTTALRGVAALGASSWVTLRPADGLTETLSARLAAALGAPEDPSALAAATGADDRRGLAERRAALLCGLAEQRPGELLLVLDDLESAGDDDAVGELLRVLCLQAPPQLHVVLCGRRITPPGLGTARGRGEVLEVTAPDLAFTVEETGRLLTARLGPEAAPMADRCCALTGGWAAALQLLIDRLGRLAPGERARALDRLGQQGARLWRTFADELVAGEPDRTRRILAVAWAGHRVSARLLAAAGLPGAASDLDSLQQRGLLVEAGDAGALALSPVLADSAAGQLDSLEAGALRETAAAWFEEQDLLEEALECRFDAGPEGRGRSCHAAARRWCAAAARPGWRNCCAATAPAPTRPWTRCWLRRCKPSETGTAPSSCSRGCSTRPARGVCRRPWRGASECCCTCAASPAGRCRCWRPRTPPSWSAQTTRWCRRSSAPPGGAAVTSTPPMPSPGLRCGRPRLAPTAAPGPRRTSRWPWSPRAAASATATSRPTGARWRPPPKQATASSWPGSTPICPRGHWKKATTARP